MKSIEWLLCCYCALAFVTVSVLWLVLQANQRKSTTFKSAQPIMLHIQHFGGLLGCIYVLISVFPVRSDAHCYCKFVLGHVGFLLIFGSITTKMWRIYRICNSGFKRVNVTNAEMLSKLCLVSSIILIYIVIAASLSSIHKSHSTSGEGFCVHGNPVWGAALLVVEAASLFFILWLTWQTRNAPSRLNDSKYVALVVGGVFLVVLFHLSYVLDDAEGRRCETSTAIGVALVLIWVHLLTTGVKTATQALLLEQAGESWMYLFMAKVSLQKQITNVAKFSLLDMRQHKSRIFTMNSNVGYDMDTGADETIKERTLTDDWELPSSAFLPSMKTARDDRDGLSVPTAAQDLWSVVMKDSRDVGMALLLDSIQLSCKRISIALQEAREEGIGSGKADNQRQRQLDAFANQTLAKGMYHSGACCVLVSSEHKRPMYVEEQLAGDLCVAFCALNGATNLNCNIVVGTTFAVWKKTSVGACVVADVLKPGREMLCAGYCLYSSSTELVLSFGKGIRRFLLDPTLNNFLLNTRAPTEMPAIPKEYYSVNEGNFGAFDKTMQCIVDGFKAHYPLPYSLRYVGSFIADIHRTILCGGVYLSPVDVNRPNGNLHVLYECAPLAYLIEQAGGEAITGMHKGKIMRILDIHPTDIHELCPFIGGCSRDIDYVRKAHSASPDTRIHLKKDKHAIHHTFRQSNSAVPLTPHLSSNSANNNPASSQHDSQSSHHHDSSSRNQDPSSRYIQNSSSRNQSNHQRDSSCRVQEPCWHQDNPTSRHLAPINRTPHNDTKFMPLNTDVENGWEIESYSVRSSYDHQAMTTRDLYAIEDDEMFSPNANVSKKAIR